jgi:sulfate permease, SulP family
VLAGFKAGTGLLIASGQLGKVLGVEQTGDSFFQKTRSALSHLGEISWPTFGLAAATVAGLLALKRTRMPGALVAVAAGIGLGATGALDIALTGHVPGGLPTPVAPDLALIGPLLPAAAGIALMSFVESIAAGRAMTHDDEDEPDADKELVALGAANLVGGVFRTLPAGGGLSQTAVNDAAATKRAGAVTAIVTLLTLLFLTGLFADLPQATLGALVLVSAIGLVQLGPLREIGAIHPRGGVLGLLTMLGVLTLGVLQGVLIGVLASMLLLVHALNHPHIERLENGDLKVHGPLYFANVQRVRRRVLELDPNPVLDMSAVTGIDVTAAAILKDLAPRMHGLNPHARRVMRHVSPAVGEEEHARAVR